MRVFNEMSVRRAMGFLWAGAGIAATLILGLAALTWPAALADGGMGVPVFVVWGALGALAAVLAACWAVGDRILVIRLHDRRSLPARPEFHGGRGFAQPSHADELDGRDAGGAALRGVRYRDDGASAFGGR